MQRRLSPRRPRSVPRSEMKSRPLVEVLERRSLPGSAWGPLAFAFPGLVPLALSEPPIDPSRVSITQSATPFPDASEIPPQTRTVQPDAAAQTRNSMFVSQAGPRDATATSPIGLGADGAGNMDPLASLDLFPRQQMEAPPPNVPTSFPRSPAPVAGGDESTPTSRPNSTEPGSVAASLVTPPAQVASLSQATLEAMAQASPAPVALPIATGAGTDSGAGAPAAPATQASATPDSGASIPVNSIPAALPPAPLAHPARPTLPISAGPPNSIPPTLFDQLNEMPLGGSSALAEFAPDIPCSSCDTASSLIDTQEGYPANPCMDSEAPVRYADGTVNLTFQDLSSNGFGVPWGQTRTWTNNATYAASTLNGWGMFDVQQPFLARYGASQIVLFLNGHDARYFQDNGDGTYSEHFSGKEGLKFDGAHFILSDHKGTRLFFSAPVDTNHNGLLLSINDPYGGATTFTYSGTPSQLQSVTRTDAASGITETYAYGYMSGFLASVTLSRSNTPGTIREVDYTYYGVNGINEPNNGNLGDLRTATIKDGSNHVLDVSYYRSTQGRRQVYVPVLGAPGDSGGRRASYSHSFVMFNSTPLLLPWPVELSNLSCLSCASFIMRAKSDSS